MEDPILTQIVVYTNRDETEAVAEVQALRGPGTQCSMRDENPTSRTSACGLGLGKSRKCLYTISYPYSQL